MRGRRRRDTKAEEGEEKRGGALGRARGCSAMGRKDRKKWRRLVIQTNTLLIPLRPNRSGLRLRYHRDPQLPRRESHAIPGGTNSMGHDHAHRQVAAGAWDKLTALCPATPVTYLVAERFAGGFLETFLGAETFFEGLLKPIQNLSLDCLWNLV